jgi:benzoyl-CoA reductase/2-hydroxyglutaryl-CoA dehydratase subunit BcrC/BadD/HgdB
LKNSGEARKEGKGMSGARGESEARTTNQLRSAQEAVAYQKEWFKSTRERLSQGEPFVLANADTPHEIFLTMDIPVVMTQWWSAIISAKRLSPHYFDLMNERGYQRNLCRYCSLPLASAMDHNPDQAPWGGLPKPTLVLARLTCDALTKIFERLAREYQAIFFPLEHSAPTSSYPLWWERIKDHWNEVIEPHRLDLMVEELKALIRFLEVTTGKTFSHAKFVKVMELINRQEAYYKKTRDLIAETVPCPVGLPDQIASTMNSQWHRGTPWGLDHARRFYEEVKERVKKGEAACQNEKARLMWIGPGLWHNVPFYQYFEERYGAVFVCSIYLSLAADGYARECLNDPLRALASRHVSITELMYHRDWLVKEARMHSVSGAVIIVSKSCIRPVGGSVGWKFTQMAFEAAGIPVLPIYADVVDAREWNDEEIKGQVSRFIEEKVRPR